MKSFQQKKAELAKIKEKLAKAKITIFTSFANIGEKGLNVTEMQTLKKGLRAADSEYMVGKKTLLDKAIKDKKQLVDVFAYNGSMGVALGYGDEITTAKTIYNFAKKNPAIKLFGALMGGQVMDEKAFIEFAKLPTKEILIARFMGLIRYPLSSLASVLGQVANSK